MIPFAPNSFAGMRHARPVSAVLLTCEQDHSSITIADGQRLILVCRDAKPCLAADTSPGAWIVSATQIAPGSMGFPAVVLLIDLAHVAAWLAFPAANTRALVDAVARLAAESALTCHCPNCQLDRATPSGHA